MILAALGKTALRWALYAVAFVILLSAINYGLSFVPFTPQWSAKQAAVNVKNLEGQVESLEATATGNAEIGQAVETHHTREVIIREATASAISDARSEPDAETPIPAPRADRFDAHYRSVCDATPDVCPAPDAP